MPGRRKQANSCKPHLAGQQLPEGRWGTVLLVQLAQINLRLLDQFAKFLVEKAENEQIGLQA
ncbi:hypothetical protein F511_15299 [Dorcoceras hygrometricum]|uniref:Uncharacterized protein n=1 Tax=Dorcoceras hygrometricum TaxID=472368 RepID=A0A2Z7AEG1_9LAMI|nr:hypothetical protein F511_15299 [Dorcoceras hygrometricum]